jgi:hypothetical protein
MSRHIVQVAVQLDLIEDGPDAGFYDTTWGPASLIEIQEAVHQMINAEELDI